MIGRIRDELLFSIHPAAQDTRSDSHNATRNENIAVSLSFRASETVEDRSDVNEHPVVSASVFDSHSTAFRVARTDIGQVADGQLYGAVSSRPLRALSGQRHPERIRRVTQESAVSLSFCASEMVEDKGRFGVFSHFQTLHFPFN